MENKRPYWQVGIRNPIAFIPMITNAAVAARLKSSRMPTCQ